MKKSDTSWQRLVAAARQAAPVIGDEAAPLGFSTRVAALAMERAEAPTLGASINRYSWKALALSLVLMGVSIAANYSAVNSLTESAHETDFDPVEEVLTLS